jgi:hypothetical protein
MKIVRVVCLSASLVLSSLAFAKLALPNDVLGRVEGGLDACAKADPQSASKYMEKKKELAEGASEQELAEARASADYKQGYAAGSEEIAKQPKDQAKKACSSALEGK